MTLSIIVPFFNASSTISRCIDSILSQSLHDFELILIDDGSTDNTADKCRKYILKYSNIRLLHQKNCGPGAARNYGIKMASGKYIGFCDADDYVDIHMYNKLVSAAEKSGADISICDYYSERDRKAAGIPWPNGTRMSKKEIRAKLIPSLIGNERDFEVKPVLWGSVCKSVFRKSVIDCGLVTFPTEIRFAEDLIFTLRFLSIAQRAIIVNKVMYYYTYNKESLMNSHVHYKAEMFYTRKKVLDLIADVLNNLGIFNKVRKRLYVTARAYVHEAVGNACRDVRTRGAITVYRELKTITLSEVSQEAFSLFEWRKSRKSLVYWLIYYRLIIPIMFYYCIRFKGE